MLAEKFFLTLETVISHGYPDGSTRVVSTSRQVPVKLPRSAQTRPDLSHADPVHLGPPPDPCGLWKPDAISVTGQAAAAGREFEEKNLDRVLIGIKFWPARQAMAPPLNGGLDGDSGSTAKLETL